MQLTAPLCSLRARVGLPVHILIDVMEFAEAGNYVATSLDLRELHITSRSLDELKSKIDAILASLFDINRLSTRVSVTTYDLRFSCRREHSLSND